MTNKDFEVSEIPRLDGYVAMVTGGNAGVGYETTLQLARRGARVYIAGRNQQKVSEAIAKMQKTEKSLDVRFVKLDLQDLQGVKTTAADFAQNESKLDILICNAGIMSCPYELTKDGYELQWQTCFLAHHALTLSLLPQLRAAAKAHPDNKGRVRIVNVASDAAFVFGPKQIYYKDPNMAHLNGSTAPWTRYGHCKQAIVIAAKAINDRYSHEGITSYSLHPGIIKTNLQSYGPGVLGSLSRVAMKVFPTISPLDGARTSLYCATSPNAPAHAGRFFAPYGKLNNKPDKWLNDEQAVRKLWDLGLNQLKANGFNLDL